MEPPKFLADHMNGDIARWLRIMGFDCEYPPPAATDDEILAQADRESRVVITSDRELYSRARRRGLNAVLLVDAPLEQKIAKILKDLHIETLYGTLSPRCTACNGELERVHTLDVRDQLPKKLMRTFRYIHRCKRCGRLYWEGTHWKNIKETLRKIASNL